MSLFVDPVPAEAEAAPSVGADRVELYTEAYARAFPTAERDAVFARYRATAERAVAVGLGVNAGHDLDLENLPFFARHLPGLQEVSIGHALISDALYAGLAPTVAAYPRRWPAGKTDRDPRPDPQRGPSRSRRPGSR